MVVLFDAATNKSMILIFDDTDIFNATTTRSAVPLLAITHPAKPFYAYWFWFRIVELNAINAHFLSTMQNICTII